MMLKDFFHDLFNCNNSVFIECMLCTKYRPLNSLVLTSVLCGCHLLPPFTGKKIESLSTCLGSHLVNAGAQS